MISRNALRNYIKAGNIARKVREKVKELVQEEMPLLELNKKVEDEITKHGAKPAFPVNIGINEIAAHYTPPPFEERTLPRHCIVKIDFGVQINGYIADTALTISFNPAYNQLIEVADKALESALNVVKPSIKVREIGKVIQRAIEERGFKPIWNLQGHEIARYNLHAGKMVPNVSFLNDAKMELGEVYAIEPFVTLKRASGEVKEMSQVFIYRFEREVPLENEALASFLKLLNSKFGTLPFSVLWVQRYWQKSLEDIYKVLNKLVSLHALIPYPVLIEKSKCIVAQSEHTLMIAKDGALLLT